ncbi:retrovirus-related pol polyprotein from transposon TNT 1-94 [Tanacetum coccineum]
MSEAEPIPPTSSVTALRIPMIKKGEYDLWSMKMRQYIAITDHILWDIITNGDQATTDPASSSSMENYGENLNALTFNQSFEINELKAQSQEKDTIIRKLKERIKPLSGKDSVENVKRDIDEIETINIELEHSVAKLLLKNENLRKEREHLKSTFKDQFDSIGKTRVQSKAHCNSLIAKRMFKLDIEALSPGLKNNRNAHEVYIEKTIEYTNTIRGFIKSARTQNPSEPLLESAYMFTKHVHELLVYVSQTCVSSPKSSGKLLAITPINKDKRVRFAEPVTSSNNILKQTDSLKTKDSTKPLLTSTGVKSTTSASGSNPSGNTKNNRITRPPRSNQKNKVEDPPRKVKSSLNKTNSASKPISNALVKNSVRNAKFESMRAICNKCLFDANHDICLIDFVNVVNVRSKTKSKRNKKKKLGNLRKIVHLKETTSKSVETPKPEIKVYSRRPKQIKSVGSSKKAKIVESKTTNNSKSTHLWGSNPTDVPSSSSLVNDRALDYKLFSVGQFCDADLEVAFQKNDCIFRSKDEAPNAIIKCIKNIQVRLNATVHNVRTDNGTGFVNQTLRLGLQVLTPATSSSGLVPNIIPQQPCNPPKRDDWDTLFQPLFDEYFNPLTIVVFTVPVAAAPRGFEESPKTPLFHDDPLHEPLHEDLTSQGSSSNVRPSHTPFELIGRWTKDHPIANVIGDPSRSVSTRKQLKTDAMWCYFDAFLTSVEPKNFKQAMTEPSWIDAMQEEIHEFERLQVWELVPCLDKVMLIKLKWIYKVKTDEFGGEYSSHVYKLKKALYSLKQAPRTWYDMLSSFLISQHFCKGAADPTLFIQKAGNDLLLVQIYVDDIIFASTNTALFNEFANQMTTKFKMSMMGHMSFFLGL